MRRSYAAPHVMKTLGELGRTIAPEKSTAPMQLALPWILYHLICGRMRRPEMFELLPLRRTLPPRSGHAAYTSIPPNALTATGVGEGEGVCDGVGVDDGDTYARFHTVPLVSENNKPLSAASAGEEEMAAPVPRE